MLVLGLIKEGKIPADNRVALTPAHCRWLQKNFTDVKVIVQPCDNRCFTNAEYERAGITVQDDLSACNLLVGIKEVPVNDLIPGKRYMFFSHTRKKQESNRKLMQALLRNTNSLIDFECLEHADGQRIIGFGFFAGVVGAHNGMMAYGNRTGAYALQRVKDAKSYNSLVHTYFGLNIPNIKVAVTGSGRVASGVLEILNLMGLIEVEPEEYLEREFTYPVYVHLKGADLYQHKAGKKYNRVDFHQQPQEYRSLFLAFALQTDILMNGVYWDKNIPRLFSWEDMLKPDFRIVTIADISDDRNGSIPCNLGDATIEEPVYGVDSVSRQVIAPYQKYSVDVMAVGNLPNELPRDASRYFGDQLIKYVLNDLRQGTSDAIEKATIVRDGQLTPAFTYLHDYAYGKV